VDGQRYGAHLSRAFRAAWHQWVDGFEKGDEDWQNHIDVEPLSGEQVQQSAKTEEHNMKNDDAVMIDFIEKEKNGIAKITGSPGNGVSTNGSVNGHHKNGTSAKTEEKPEAFKIETRDGVTICTAPDAELLTPHVLLEQKQWYENDLNFVRDYVKPGMTFLDIGAGFGVYSLPAAKLVGDEGCVFAFEPGASAKHYLEMSKLENGFGQLEVIGKAINNKNGKQDWSTGKTPEFNRLDDSGEETVSSVTLDAWWQFEGEPVIDVIKIDVNGNEANVLSGATDLLEKESPVILLSITEVGPDAFTDILAKLGYSLFEYIPGPGLLTAHDREVGSDPYMQNLVAVKGDRLESIRDSGWLHDETVTSPEVDSDLWKSELSKLPWTASMMEMWDNQKNSEGIDSYLQALNYLIRAEQIDVKNTELKEARSQKAVLMLEAAQILINLYNQGANSTSVVFTLVRTLNALGKRSQAVEVMQKLIESTKLGQENMNVDLPFMLPVPKQDNAPIKTEPNKWLMVKTIEAWILLKDMSTWFSGAQEKKLLEVLDGNLEVIDCFHRISLVIKSSNDEQLDSVQRERFLDLVEVDEHYRNVKAKIQKSENFEKQDITQKIFNQKFWSEQLTPAKAKKIVEITKKFIQPKFGAEVLNQIIEETKNRLKESGDDNVAFFIQVHALLALNGKNKNTLVLNKELAKAMKRKSWKHKAELYDYWFDNVDYRNEVENPEVSAIIISNRFKDKSVENLKRLSQQLEGRGEIIFVNNGIDDSEFDPLIEYVDTYVKTKGNSGAYLARNLGALFAKGKYLLFVDDDGIPDDGFVDGHLNVRKERDVIVSRGVYYSDNPKNDPWHYDLGDKEKPAVNYLEGNAVYNKDEFYLSNGWGDYILFGHGGMELSFRMLALDPNKEKQIYIPSSRLQHNYYRGEVHKKEKIVKQERSFKLISFNLSGINRVVKGWPKIFGEHNNMRSINDSIISFNTNRLSSFKKLLPKWRRSVSKLQNNHKVKTSVKHDLPNELIVTLTSYPKRFDNLPLTLQSLLNQSVCPDKVILWIAETDKKYLTQDIKDYASKGLTIKYCDDIKSYKKIIPALEQYPDCFLITADDDLFYHKDWIKNLVEKWDSKNPLVIANRVHRITFDQDRNIEPYKKWKSVYRENLKGSDLNFPTSGAGILYPPKAFHKDVTDREKFMQMAPFADDVWLYWMIRLNNFKISISDYYPSLVIWPSLNNENLWIQNKLGGRNDKYIRNLIDEYGLPIESTSNSLATKGKNDRDVFSVVVSDGDYKIYLPQHKTDHIQKIIAGSGKPYEQTMLSDMNSRVNNDDLIIDVGANIGNHTLFMACAAKCYVKSFEPNKNLVESLQKSIKINGLESRVEVIQKGVGAVKSYAKFNKSIDHNLGAQSLSVSNRKSDSIEVVTLDSIKFEGKVRLLKIDVEGMELDVLKGSERVLRESKPILYVEANENKDFLLINNFLEKHDYEYQKTFNATPTHLFINKS
jgi:FkbM family methyltransferase